jgi:hypothetical protein
MQPVEALTRIIAMADAHTAARSELSIPLAPQGEITEVPNEELEQDKLAVSIAQAMLNTAIPVARFRCFVKIESGPMKDREYTICAVNIEDIATALYGLARTNIAVYITLWEQRATGADMLDSYQGKTRMSKGQFNRYLDELRRYAVTQTVQ